jgi:hypothetical protein
MPLCCVWEKGQRCVDGEKYYGRCLRHFRILRDEEPTAFARLKSLPRPARDLEYAQAAMPPAAPQHWQYENPDGENFLAQLCERRQQYLDNHVVEPLLSWTELDDLIAAEELESKLKS